MKVKSEKDTPAPAEIRGHPFHSTHKLNLITADDAGRFVCDGCKELGGAGCARYACEEAGCDFDLHAPCALAPDVLPPEHTMFKGDAAFVLLHEPPPTTDDGDLRVCDACGDEVRGFVYHCFDRDLDLHPCCAHLPGRVALGGVAFELSSGGGGGGSAPRRCLYCRTGEGSRPHLRRKYWTYSSDDFDGEAVHLHVACVKRMAYESSSAGSSSHRIDGGGRNMPVIRAPVQAAVALRKNGRSRSKLKKFLKIVAFVLRVVVGVLFGDPTAMAVAVVGLVFPNG
uniref:DC1 domain-containing protein n=1 Tax=Oryza punctata TaxID=4537 RepID=A0A0E0LUR2_ORYPU